MGYDKENFQMSSNKRYIAWTLPMGLVIAGMGILLFMQSCGTLPEQPDSPNIKGIGITLKASLMIFGLTLVTGLSCCYYMYTQVTKVSNRLKKLGFDDV